jgi:hypothetical protein
MEDVYVGDVRYIPIAVEKAVLAGKLSRLEGPSGEQDGFNERHEGHHCGK